MPTVYLTSWDAKQFHGPGRKFSIMDDGADAVYPLLPMREDILSFEVGTMPAEQYRARCETRFDTFFAWLKPGALRPQSMQFAGKRIVVESGDTLCCECNVGVAKAGTCHRVWAAPFLHEAGWTVILDGDEWSPK